MIKGVPGSQYYLQNQRIHVIKSDIYPPFLGALKGKPLGVQHEWIGDARKVTWFDKLKASLFVWYHTRVHKK